MRRNRVNTRSILPVCTLLCALVLFAGGCASQMNTHSEPEPVPSANTDSNTSADSTGGSGEAGTDDLVFDSELIPPESGYMGRSDSMPLIIPEIGGFQQHPMDSWSFEKPKGPLPPAEEPVEITPGWRVQIAAVKEESEAGRILSEYKPVKGEKVHQTWVNGWYKLQAGDFQNLNDAEELKSSLSVAYPGAFVTGSNVIQSESVEKTKPQKPTSQVSPPKKTGTMNQKRGWRIQLMSLESRDKAKRTKEELARKIKHPMYLMKKNGRYAILAGDFIDRKNAEAALNTLRQGGWKDAWIIESKISTP